MSIRDDISRTNDGWLRRLRFQRKIRERKTDPSGKCGEENNNKVSGGDSRPLDRLVMLLIFLFVSYLFLLNNFDNFIMFLTFDYTIT